ncbi:hypothetical protein L209DRAFT_763219 [Thermothelomyces heterothallicus CBS 203.75]
MSLNGLDDARVTEAYEAAVAEPGGWFLLKYASRDEVELLGRGNGGIVEIRNNIAQYEDKSPLYGFLRYRRRSVIIKYLPEDCSRLIQARVTVHFEAISEAKELRDTKLSAACSLHAASGSTSSSTSSLQEEEEERERKRQSVAKEEARPKSSAAHSEAPVKLDANLANLPDASRFANDLEPPNFTGAQRPSSPAISSSRTDLYPTTSYPYSKPRVKIGPRPSADPAGRPRSSASGSAPRVSTARSQSQGHGEEAPESPIETVAGANLAGKAPADTSAAHKPDAPAIAQPPAKQNLREQKKMMSLQTTPDVPGADKQDIEAVADAPLPEGRPDKADEQQEEVPETPKPDSAMDIGTDHASLDTTLDSHPSSPTAASEIGGSTQASSLSDSTNETVLAKEERANNESEASQVKDDGQPESAQREALPSEERADGTASALPDRQSQATITAPNDGFPAAAEEKVEVQTVSSTTASDDAVPKGLPVSASSDSPAQSSTPEDKAADGTAAETVEEPASHAKLPEAKPSDAEPIGDERTPITQQIRIPVSKFSTQETRPPTSSASQGLPLIAANTSDVDSWRVEESAPPVPEKDTVTGATNVSDAVDVDSKLRKLPERIRTNLDVLDSSDKRRSVISITDNDGFMDELQSATVQQATPVTVSKSPISPVFGVDQTNKPASAAADNTASAPKFLRTASNPVRNSFLAPSELASPPARSASSGSAYMQRVSQQQQQQQPSSELRPKSAKLGSSISQRIKALEKLSGGGPGGEQVNTPKERPATTFFAVRKASVREGSRPSSVAERTTSRDSSSPEATRNMGRGRSGSLVNRLSMFEGGMPPRGRPESVQVTARIPRGSQADYPPLDLRQSQLTVDVQNCVNSQSPVRPASVQTLLERRLSKQSREGDRDTTMTETSDGPRPRRRSSLSFSIIGVKSPSTDNLGNPLSPAATASQASAGPRPSSHAPSVQHSRRSSLDQNGSGPSVSSGSGMEEKNPNKASRASRKNGAPSISPTVTEENAAEVEAASKGSTAATGAAAQPSIIAFMGDVNVQFPDNLFQGFLILSAGQGTAMIPPVSGKDRHGAMVKRYHMSDFKPPFAPDVELQELPNSVVLDLVDGSGLQIACEDRAGQMNVLRILEEAHRNFANY